MSKYRHEYKYMIENYQKALLLVRASGLMKKDANVGKEGNYLIRSLYFDDLDNSCYYENENGTDPRSKFRIRYYNYDTYNIKMEKKIKIKGMTQKVSCKITKEQCEIFMQGKVPKYYNEIQHNLFEEIEIRKLLPRVIVSYVRIPFVYPIGNVRITFDSDITSSNEVTRFLEQDFRQRPILPMGKSILEVKWDELIPMHIKEYMNIDKLQWNTFSKYYLSRKYNTNGGM